MDCALVKERCVTERYLFGRLSEDERAAFEEHYFECDKCFGELETLREIRAQLAESKGEIRGRTSTARPQEAVGPGGRNRSDIDCCGHRAAVAASRV